MRRVDWRDLYASNRAVIERAHEAAGLSTPHTTIAAGRTRRTLVHTPAGGDPGTARPLVCMLHGCTQDAATFAAATRMNDAADRHGFIVVYPQQERRENAQRCWNWFDGRHQARGAGEPASIAAVVRDLIGTTTPWAVDPRRVFVAGLSAGGAMAAVMAAAYPDLFAAVAVHSGLAYRSAGSVRAAFAAMARGAREVGEVAGPVPSIVIHGSDDRTVAPVNGEQVLAQSMAAEGLDPARPTSTIARPRPGRPRLHALALAGCARSAAPRAIGGRGHGARVVRRPARRLLHRPPRPRRDRGDLELLRGGRAAVSTSRANLLAPANGNRGADHGCRYRHQADRDQARRPGEKGHAEAQARLARQGQVDHALAQHPQRVEVPQARGRPHDPQPSRRRRRRRAPPPRTRRARRRRRSTAASSSSPA